MTKLRSNATQAYACFAADCSVRCDQSHSGLNDSIQTGMALISVLGEDHQWSVASQRY